MAMLTGRETWADIVGMSVELPGSAAVSAIDDLSDCTECEHTQQQRATYVQLHCC